MDNTAVCTVLLVVFLVSTGSGLQFGSDENDAICGTRPGIRPGPQPRIFNGREAPTGAWPWMGRIIYPEHLEWECMVVLISEQWAIGALDCGRAANTKIQFGDNFRKGSSPYRQEVGIRRVYDHPLDPNGLFVDGLPDLTVIQLENPVMITDFVRPVCLIQFTNGSVASDWETYENCWVTGWGETDAYGVYPEVLQEAPTRFLSVSECRDVFETTGTPYNEIYLCGRLGSNGEPRVCSDDVGAPMVCTGDDGQWYLLGQFLAYFGACGDNLSIFNRQPYYVEFIEETVRRVEACNSPDYLCQDGLTCVLAEERCDGETHCPDDDDEIACEGDICEDTTCQNGGTCMETDEGGYACECLAGATGRNCEIVSCGPSTIQVTPEYPVNITSLFYPARYPDLSACNYTVYVPDGYKVLVEFLIFNVTDWYDVFKIDNTIINRLNVPLNLTSDDETFDISFVSDEIQGSPGFVLMLSAIDVTGINECLWSPCLSTYGGVCTDEEDGYSCQCIDPRFDRYCITPVNFCGPEDILLDTETPVTLTSFFYNYTTGNIFEIPYKCRYNIKAPKGYRVRVAIDAITLDYPPYDNLFIGDKPYRSDVGEYLSEDEGLEIIFTSFFGSPLTEFRMVIQAENPYVNECLNQLCRHGGICIDKDFGFDCKCRRGYSGKTCQIGLSLCGKNKFTCNNRRCIKASNVCDGRNNCGDGSDEFNCDCEFQCYNGRCIPERLVCDGNNNCNDNSDELRPEC